MTSVTSSLAKLREAASPPEEEPNDPVKNFYIHGYNDAKAGKKRRVPHHLKLTYTNGEWDARKGKPSRYAEPAN